MVFIDGERWPPSIHGTGTEEIFGGGACPAREYAGPYHGFHLIESPDYAGLVGAYRWFVHDPIRFTRSLRWTVEHGHANNFANEYASVAYWYQTEPHAPFPRPAARAMRSGRGAAGRVRRGTRAYLGAVGQAMSDSSRRCSIHRSDKGLRSIRALRRARRRRSGDVLSSPGGDRRRRPGIAAAAPAAPPPLSADDAPAVDSTYGSGSFGTWHVDATGCRRSATRSTRPPIRARSSRSWPAAPRRSTRWATTTSSPPRSTTATRSSGARTACSSGRTAGIPPTSTTRAASGGCPSTARC